MKRTMIILSGFLLVGVLMFAAGHANASPGNVWDSATLSYYNAAGGSPVNTQSNSVYVTVVAGPLLSIAKAQKRMRDGGSYVTTVFTVASNDSVTYRLTLTNAAGRDTATLITVTDTLTFWNAAALSESVTIVAIAGTDSSTSVGTSLNAGGANGTVSGMFYTTDPTYTTWTAVGGISILANISQSNYILGVRWTINKFMGDVASITENMYFTVKFP